MGVKGDNARAKIIECAQTLFSQKGYCAVTMQDVSELSGFSRGGLYRHFPSTEEIFLEIIRLEQEAALASLDRALADQLRPDHILRGFLRSRMEKLSRPSQSFDVAVSEFAANSDKGREALAKRARVSVQILTRLIIGGNEAGVFTCADPEVTATHIMWLMEGMSRHASLMPISQAQIEAQITKIEQLL